MGDERSQPAPLRVWRQESALPELPRPLQAFRRLSLQLSELQGVFQAAKEDFECGYLFSVRGLIKAEDSTDILEQATEILRAGYKDPACVLAGVALEIAIKELCTRNGIPHARLDAMNVELCKKDVYNMGMQKQITTWAHWRNKAAHGEWNEYKDSDVGDMATGVTRFVAGYL